MSMTLGEQFDEFEKAGFVIRGRTRIVLNVLQPGVQCLALDMAAYFAEKSKRSRLGAILRAMADVPGVRMTHLRQVVENFPGADLSEDLAVRLYPTVKLHPIFGWVGSLS